MFKMRCKKSRKKISYEFAPDIMKVAEDLINTLSQELGHIDINSISCIRSFNSSARRTIARCHALSKVMQLSLGRKGFYVLEFLSERFDKMPEEERIKVVLHELMHVPRAFGGGFKHHDYVNKRRIESFFRLYKNLKRKEE